MAIPVRRVVARWTFVVVLLLSGGVFAADKALEEKFATANAKLNAGKATEAVELYNEILEAAPGAGNVWIMRAIAKWELKDFSGARADLAQAIKLHPDHIHAYRVRAQLRYELRDYQGSLADLNKAIGLVHKITAGASDPKAVDAFYAEHAELYAMRGEVHARLEDAPSAIHDLNQAIDFKPDYIEALFSRAELYDQTGERAAAMEDYSRIIEIDGSHAAAYLQRAWLQFYDLKWDEAIFDAREALNDESQEPRALRVTGYAQFANGDYTEAVKALTLAADKAEGDGAAFSLFVRHFAMVRLGKPDKRVATSWGNWGDDPWVQALGKFIAGILSEEELVQLAESASDDDVRAGRHCEAHFYIGLTRLQAGDTSTARLRFQAAVSTEKKTFIEYTLAQAELMRLARK